MEINNVAKQIYDVQKSAVYNTFDTFVLMQAQLEQYGSNLLEQNPALPQQTKTAMNEWVDLQNKARSDYKKILDESFKNLETAFSEITKNK